MSKVQNKTAKKKAFRMTVANRMRRFGVPEGGATVVVERGTAALKAEPTAAPCPFCGGNAKHVTHSHWGGILVPGASCDNTACHLFGYNFPLEWWNKRADPVGVPVWRDPAVEMPDDDISVIGRFESEDYPVYPTLHDEHGWGPGDGGGGTYTDKLVGWLHIHEAAEILDAARKAVTNA